MEVASRTGLALLTLCWLALPCACKSDMRARDGSVSEAARDVFFADRTPEGEVCCTVALRGVFVSTGSMTKPRGSHTATLLANGTVLVAGGEDANDQPNAVGSAELFDPTVTGFALTGRMSEPRLTATATRLADNNILIAGGSDGIEGDLQTGVRGELYDVATATFGPTGSMSSSQRIGHTASLLSTGNVLIVGGMPFVLSGVTGYAKAELYVAQTGSFVDAGNTTVVRVQHTATLLLDGRVLLAGGNGSENHASAEIYDPATSSFVATGSLSVARRGHAAARLLDGRVLVVGGWNGSERALASAELYDPATGSFAPTGSMLTGRASPTATALCDGRVFVAGGADGNGDSLSSTELYDPNTGAFTLAGNMLSARFGHTATRLCDGRVLLAGGSMSGTLLATAELFE